MDEVIFVSISSVLNLRPPLTLIYYENNICCDYLTICFAVQSTDLPMSPFFTVLHLCVVEISRLSQNHLVYPPPAHGVVEGRLCMICN